MISATTSCVGFYVHCSTPNRPERMLQSVCAKTAVSTDILFLFYFDVIRRDSAEFWCDSWGVLVLLCWRAPPTTTKNTKRSVRARCVNFCISVVIHRTSPLRCRMVSTLSANLSSFRARGRHLKIIIRSKWNLLNRTSGNIYTTVDSSEKNKMIGRFVHRNYRFGTCTSSSFRTLECSKALGTVIQCSDAI